MYVMTEIAELALLICVESIWVLLIKNRRREKLKEEFIGKQVCNRHVAKGEARFPLSTIPNSNLTCSPVSQFSFLFPVGKYWGGRIVQNQLRIIRTKLKKYLREKNDRNVRSFNNFAKSRIQNIRAIFQGQTPTWPLP